MGGTVVKDFAYQVRMGCFSLYDWEVMGGVALLNKEISS